MKTKTVKRVLATGLLTAMVFSLCSCGSSKVASIEPMKEEEVHSLSFDVIGGDDVMPIGGYFGPGSKIDFDDGRKGLDHYTDEVFELIKGTGVNLLVYANADYNYSKDYVYKELDLAVKYGLGVYVSDSLLSNPGQGEVLSKDEVDARLLAYSDHPAYAGTFMVDEPASPLVKPELTAKYISGYASMYQTLNELGIVGSVNLFPQKTGGDSQYEDYAEYVEEFCSTCAPMYLCYDYYLWDADTTTEGYFRNMSIIRSSAEKYEIPFWCFIQAGGQWNDAKQYFDSTDYYPSEGQFYWNVNTALACGAKGINYFPLIQPIHFAYASTGEFDFQRNSLIGAMGNKTQWYYYAQNMNKQIQAVDSVLMNAVNKGVIAASDAALKDAKYFEYLLDGESFRELQSVDGDAMIGCFNYKGKTALYVTNYSYKYAQKITLNLQDTYNLNVIQDGETKKVSTNQLTLDMKAGEGALVVFE